MKNISVLLLIAFFVFGGISYADLNDGLIAYYPFNGNANDESGNGNNGVENGGVTYSTGKIGQAASFDGVDDFIEIVPISDVSSIGDFTISAWTYVTGWKDQATDRKGDRQYIFDGHTTSKTASAYDIYRPGFCLIYDMTYSSNRESIHTFIKTPNIKGIENDIQETISGDWHHLVFTRIGDENYTYFDGVKFNSTSSNKSDEKLDMDHPWHIGTFAGNNPNYDSGYTYSFKGFIDEIRIYNRALSESEIQDLGGPTPCSEDRYDEGKQAGIEYCKNNPSACGIDISGNYDNGYKDGKDFCKNNPDKCNMTCTSLGCSNGGSDDNCATFNFFENTLHIPCFDAGTANYWIDLEFVNGDPVTFELKNAGPNE